MQIKKILKKITIACCIICMSLSTVASGNEDSGSNLPSGSGYTYKNEDLGIQCIFPDTWYILGESERNEMLGPAVDAGISYELIAMNFKEDQYEMLQVISNELTEEAGMLMEYLDIEVLMEVMKSAVLESTGIIPGTGEIEVEEYPDFPLENYGCFHITGQVENMEFRGRAILTVLDNQLYEICAASAAMDKYAEDNSRELLKWFTVYENDKSTSHSMAEQDESKLYDVFEKIFGNKEIVGSWTEDEFNSGYTFNDDYTGVDIFWSLPFSYCITGNYLIIQFDDPEYESEVFSYSVNDDTLLLKILTKGRSLEYKKKK